MKIQTPTCAASSVSVLAFVLSTGVASGEPRAFCVPEDCTPGYDCCSEEVLEIHFVDSDGRLDGHAKTAAAGERVRVAVTIDVASDPVQAWSYTVKHDPSVMTIASVTIEDTDAGALGQSAFVSTGLAFRDGVANQGFAQTALFGLIHSFALPVKDDFSLAFATYIIELSTDTPTRIEFADEELSTESRGTAIDVELTVAGETKFPSGLIDAVISARSTYRRGDADGTGRPGLADVVLILRRLFGLGVPGIDCDALHDVNGDGTVAVDDPVFLLNWLFRRGERPGEPFEECGFDDSTLECDASNC